MKKHCLVVLIVIISNVVFGQAPNAFNYQAVIRDNSGSVIQNQSVNIKVGIKSDSINANTDYAETFLVTTNSHGLIQLKIGTGTSSDDFSLLSWSSSSYFIETSLDVSGGTNFVLMGSSQLLSVPYALHANLADSVLNDRVNDADSDSINELQSISRNGSLISLSNGGGSFTDSVGVYIAGNGIAIENNVVSVASNGLKVGDTYQGGIIFFLDESGEHGLISAASDLSTQVKWDNDSLFEVNASRDGNRAGIANTERIIIAQGKGSYAAQNCANYMGGNYGDWYLPSFEELNLMYNGIGQGSSLNNIGGFGDVYYWSSTEFNSTDAWTVDFIGGSQSFCNKNVVMKVRPIRAF